MKVMGLIGNVRNAQRQVPDLINNPAGQIGGMLTRRRPAREILLSMFEEAVKVIDRLDTMRVAVPQR